LLRSVVAAGKPAIYMEPKREYYRNRVDPGLLVATVDHQKCEVVRPGTDVTLFTYGPTVSLGMEAAEEMLRQGISCAVVDLVSLAPLDVEGICSLACQTKRVIAISEAVERCSIASEVVSLIARNAFDSLEAPPIVVASPNRPPPPPAFEEDYFPSVARVCEAIVRQCRDR
jgi:2-oxoisovalerate dehydrogenase E1 component subunit beta